MMRKTELAGLKPAVANDQQLAMSARRSAALPNPANHAAARGLW